MVEIAVEHQNVTEKNFHVQEKFGNYQQCPTVLSAEFKKAIVALVK